MINIIAAHDEVGVIGKDGALPWHLPADMKHFKDLTTGNVVVMGRRTYDSIGKPLPNRENVVVSKQEGLEIEGCRVVNAFEDAIELAWSLGEVWVAGGAKIYHLAMPIADKLHITLVKTTVDGGDTYFPEIDSARWHRTQFVNRDADQQNPYNLTFVTYERR